MQNKTSIYDANSIVNQHQLLDLKFSNELLGFQKHTQFNFWLLAINY